MHGLQYLGKNGLLNTFLGWFGIPHTSILYTNTAILLGMVYNFLPFMVLPIFNSLSKMDNDLINAARDLGANRFQVFTKVIFPLSIPGVVSGITMVFMPAVSTFVISRLLGGGTIYANWKLNRTTIYSQLEIGTLDLRYQYL